MKEIKTVYIAGRITGDPEYRAKFEQAQRTLEAAGFVVMSPAILPSEGFTYDDYMKVSSAMMDVCGAVYFLPDWKQSNGAMYEMGRAIATGKEIINQISVKGLESRCAAWKHTRHGKARA